jgi:hypothetical protein
MPRQPLRSLMSTIKAIQAAGPKPGKTHVALRDIADELNKREIPTARGKGDWTATQVARVLKRI